MIIYDLISLSTLLIPLYSIIYGEWKLLFGIIAVTILQLIIKDSTKNTLSDVFLRPKGACNCGSFNEGGDDSFKPGFPSGHIAVTALFVNFIYLKYYRCDFFLMAIFNVAPIIMGISRYEKKCHNVYQLVAGYILGIACVFLCFI